MKVLKIDCSLVEKILLQFIQTEVKNSGRKNAIIGLSGGLDSTLSTFLAVKALGKEHVIAVIMPYQQLQANSVKDAQELAKTLAVKSITMDIAPMVDAYFSQVTDANNIRKGNKMARERMSILYDLSQKYDALVQGTSNKSELLLGYGTIYGDMACAYNPLGDLYKTQIRQLASHMGVDSTIINKTPTAGLWENQTDEAELGYTYEEIDKLLYYMVDKRYSRQQLLELKFQEAFINDIVNKIKLSEFKRQLPRIAKISPRTIGWDFNYPLKGFSLPEH
jgi:NAD+ synthase